MSWSFCHQDSLCVQLLIAVFMIYQRELLSGIDCKLTVTKI